MKPILFNTEMVRAILEGQKTVTRRVVKHQHLAVLDSRYHREHPEVPDRVLLEKLCQPTYSPDNILYVRETWQKVGGVVTPGKYIYLADYTGTPIRWRPSIHMPREAARIFLRVTGVRVERLQDSFSAPISPIFALCAEGMDIGDDCRECIEEYGEPCCVETVDEDGSNMYGGECGLLDSIRGEFSELWDNTVKPADRDQYGWAANPWVWVISFERISKEEAAGDGEL